MKYEKNHKKVDAPFLNPANHEDSTSMDWSTKPHPETQTWVDAVGTSSFKVCSTERAPISGDRDNSLKWDWIAFGEDSIAVAA